MVYTCWIHCIAISKTDAEKKANQSFKTDFETKYTSYTIKSIEKAISENSTTGLKDEYVVQIEYE